jgi:acyl-coenzyme A synthetase/AMP-(fatty) acid ligase
MNDDARRRRAWDPWANIPADYNLGVDLTAGQVRRGLGGKPALLWENAAGATRAYTYAQLDALSSRFADALARLGVRPGDRVFLRLPSRPEFYVAALGAAKLGAVFIPTSPQFREAEIRYRLQDSGSVVAVSTPRLVGPIERVRADCPTLQNVIVVEDDDGRAPAETLAFQTLTDQAAESITPAATRNDDIAFIAYTSGTTGDPKGVVHLHRYPIGYEALVRWWHDYRANDVVACPSELGWLLPVACTFLYAMAKGLTVVLFDAQGGPFSPRRWLALIQKYRISNFTAPPSVYRLFTTVGDAAGHFDVSSWRHAVSAGEPLPADTLAAFQRWFNVPVLDGIGMSECMVYCHNCVGDRVRPGSCGRPSPGTDIALLDDDLQPVPDGQEGVLCVRRDTHPGMMKEYWRKQGRTAEIFRGPWYYSGDVLVRDADGYFWFKGRNDDVIKASGYRISPFEVESCLVCHPAVLEAAVIESADPMRGGVVKAYLVAREGVAVNEDLCRNVQAFARSQMAAYKCPRKVEFLAALPKTPSGKVKRKDLREADRRSGEPGA